MKKENDREMTGADILLKNLSDKGIKKIFGYTGGTVMHIFDAMKKFPEIDFIMSRNEQGAVFMAQAYTRASGKIACVLATSGPGITNTITGIADAKMDSIPMIIISGQVAQDVMGTDAFQETDVLGLMYPITKWAIMPDSVDQISLRVGQAVKVALQGRMGPVCIDIPKNLQMEKSSVISIPKDLRLHGLKMNNGIIENDNKLLKVVELIKNSKKPVCLLGHGVKLSKSEKEVLEFLEKNKIPFSFTFHGISTVPSDHYLSLGMMGMHGEIQANKAIHNADLIIALGMRFDDRVTGKLKEYGVNAKIIHFDIDDSEIGKNVKVDIGVLGDVKENLEKLNKIIEKNKIDALKHLLFLDKIEKWKKESEENYKKIYLNGREKKISMKKTIEILSEVTNGQDNIVTDVGQHQMFTVKFYNFKKFNSWFSSGGFGTMGFGLPAAIGVKIAKPNESVWVVVGDGSFQMNIQELEVLRQENIKINIIILNNSYLGMVRQWQDLFFDKNHAGTIMSSPDFNKIAQAYGLNYQKIEKEENIEKAFKKAQNDEKSNIIEFICDPTELVFPMIPSNNSLKEIIKNNDKK